MEIAYHMNWPGAGNDPYYAYNPGDNYARRVYYAVTGTPTLKCDGFASSPTTGAMQNSYNTRNAVDAPVSITLDISVGAQIDVDISVTATATASGTGLKFHTVLIAENLDTTGGGWLQSNFQDVMLDMAPTNAGQTFNITPGQTVTMSASFPIPTFTPMQNLAVIGFVQYDATKEIMNAKYAAVPLDFPCLTVTDYTVTDNIGGIPNGIPEPGETCELYVELFNTPPFAAATGVTASLSTTDPDITITNGGAIFPNIPTNSTGTNDDNPFVFTVSDALEAHNVTFQLDISAEGYQTTQFITFMVGVPSILLVDDDGGQTYQAAFEDDMEHESYAFNVWEVFQQGAPTAEYLRNYNVVIWHTGMLTNPVDQDEQNAIAGYLDNGGKLFMSSENISDQLTGTAFFSNYFHAQHSGNVSTTNLSGIASNPLSAGTTLLTVGGAYWPDSQSSIIPDALADSLYKFNNPAGSAAALSYYEEGEYALVYFAFPYECIHPNPTSSTPRITILNNIMDWFDSFLSPLTVSIPQASGEHLEVVRVPINTTAVTENYNITQYDVTVTWDASVLTLVYPYFDTAGAILPADWTINISNNVPGSFSATVAATLATALSGEGALGFMNFEVVGIYGNYTDLTLSSFEFTDPTTVNLENGGFTVLETGVGDFQKTLPAEFAIISAAPNPFNPATTINFSLPVAGNVKAEVYSVQGRLVGMVYDAYTSKGYHSFEFDGSSFSSGIYFLHLHSQSGEAVQKLMLMK